MVIMHKQWLIFAIILFVLPMEGPRSPETYFRHMTIALPWLSLKGPALLLGVLCAAGRLPQYWRKASQMQPVAAPA